MEERKFIKLKKEEYGIKSYIKRDLGKGKISRLDIEYTPVGEKIIIHTSKPGLVIGRRGEKIEYLTEVLKRRFKLENPHIEIKEIENPLFDSQLVADEIALALERMGNLKFKVIAYRKLQEIINAGALGCELRLTGKLPSDRSKSWRFAEGYLKKAGEPSKEIDRAQSTALTKTGVIGIKVAIMPPDARIYDKIDVDDKMLARIKSFVGETEDDDKDETKKIKDKKKKKVRSEIKEIKGEKKKIKKDLEKAIKKEEKEEKEIVSDVVEKIEGEKESIQKGEMEIAEKIGKEEKKVEEIKEEVGEKLEKLDKEEGRVFDKVVDEEIKSEEVGEYDQRMKNVVETEIKAEESGTAIMIEQDVEEGVPEEIVDKDVKKESDKEEKLNEEGNEEKDIKGENTNEVKE